MSANSSQKRDSSKEPSAINANYESSNSKSTETPSERQNATNATTQKASTSSGQRPGPKSIGHYVLGRIRLLFPSYNRHVIPIQARR